MQKICGIYKITSPKKRVYIGQSRDIISRFKLYKRYDCKRQIRLYHSLLKHGHEKHKFEILHQCDIENLNDLEIYYMELYQCFNSDYGLNLITGGGQKVKFSDESRARMSIAKKGKIGSKKSIKAMHEANRGKQRSEETKRKISEGLKGRRRPKDVVEKMRIASTGRKHTEESKKKVSIANKGKVLSQDHKQKISIGMRGNTNGVKGFGNLKTKPMLKIGDKIELESGMQYEVLRTLDKDRCDLKALKPQFAWMPDFYPVYYSIRLTHYRIINSSENPDTKN